MESFGQNNTYRNCQHTCSSSYPGKVWPGMAKKVDLFRCPFLAPNYSISEEPKSERMARLPSRRIFSWAKTWQYLVVCYSTQGTNRNKCHPFSKEIIQFFGVFFWVDHFADSEHWRKHDGPASMSVFRVKPSEDDRRRLASQERISRLYGQCLDDAHKQEPQSKTIQTVQLSRCFTHAVPCPSLGKWGSKLIPWLCL